MRHRLARRLHAVGWHALCRVAHRPWLPARLVLADGEVWEPDINGLTSTPYHY